MRTPFALTLTVLLGCNQPVEHDGQPTQQQEIDFTDSPVTWIQHVTRDEISAADLSILFIGNSHSGRLPLMLADVARRHDSTLDVVATRAEVSDFLVNHAQTVSTPGAIRKGPWDFVVLQALKYSTSGKFHYPYDGAKALTGLANENGSQVVMFPEWGRRGFSDEATRIHKIHEEVVAITGAAIAPVGLAWDRALSERPQLVLHQADGNHASRLGDYLTANVLYACITGNNPQQPPPTATDAPRANPRSAPSETLAFLERIAWETVQDHLQTHRRELQPADENSANEPR